MDMPWTGLETMVSGDLAKILNLPQPEGVLVQKVVLLSPMGLMGVRGGSFRVQIEEEQLILGGDIILAINGVQIATDNTSLQKLEAVLSAENQDKLELKLDWKDHNANPIKKKASIARLSY